jgi:hypothetical protein
MQSSTSSEALAPLPTSASSSKENVAVDSPTTAPINSPSGRPTRPTKKDVKKLDSKEGKRFFSYITIRGKKRDEEHEVLFLDLLIY